MYWPILTVARVRMAIGWMKDRMGSFEVTPKHSSLDNDARPEAEEAIGMLPLLRAN